MRKLEEITICNFKSIRRQTLKLNALNVFIGGNGAGKSNLLSVFKLLHAIGAQQLQFYIAKKGGQNALLYFGRKISESLSIELKFGESTFIDGYEFKLFPDNTNTLYLQESGYIQYRDTMEIHPWNDKYVSYLMESQHPDDQRKPAIRLISALKDYRVHHFQDTSDSARMKTPSKVEDNRYFREDGANLAAVLYWLQVKQPLEFSLIVSVIQQIAPFFGGFRLEPSRLNPTEIWLEWFEKGSDDYFNASSLSDGTLRFICLATLLLQPDLPPLILLDEPELGLHPAAITLLSDLILSASTRTQVIVATQSVTLINQFAPKDIWTVDREDAQSVFRQLDEVKLQEWLESYSIGELWEKNILGARP